MSQITEDGPLKEVAILTRAVENVVRRLIRLLIGRMSLTKLQEMVRVVFVEEAEARVLSDQPGKTATLTKLALVTGLDTRTVSKIKFEIQQNPPLHRKERFIKDITPECSILDFWCSNSRYLEKDDETPLELRIKGESPSFSSLANEILPSRGITAKSLIDRLERSKSISVDRKSQTVKLIDRNYWPEQKDKTAALEIGLATVGNLISTLAHNLETPDHSNNAFFERANWTNRLNTRNRDELRALIRANLEDAQKNAISILEEFEEREVSDNQMTAGVSFFYFEEIPSELRF